ncbi:hypothetical protein A1O3_00707 [Capronia epimyces CBS 606.96]|uniref:alpha-galactosidase n=1 Tax=Capronia epimyces CBS 606.96 TaxID=1182542 RepID=W9YGY3_9EURO|nr:uncharacterized protein A1O3_00707 [Capronia epimyces CBS 606.96]EXJ92157.1 hypothetical protein A1O3_00707 [Capronia epimyces CBS 606.96]
MLRFALFLVAILGYLQVTSSLAIESRGTTTRSCAARPSGLWKPSPGTTWDYQLSHPITSASSLNTSLKVWDVDVFDNNATTIQAIQSLGLKVICYFSAGSYEDWRPDASSFDAADLGSDLDGWPGERWLNVSSPAVRTIMDARLDLAVRKGCDGVDPDNIDGYENDNGLNLTQDDAVDFVLYLANQAHSRNLSVGLKNGGAILPDVIDCMDWSVNEQCVEYNECDVYAPFIKQNKPVFHVEYPKGDDVNNNDDVSESTKEYICGDASASGFSTILKNIDLDSWIETC